MVNGTDGPSDGASLAILSNRLQGVARKMANTLLRTGRSGVLNIARDFSCCILTARNELLAAADSLPIHVLSRAGPDVRATMQQFHPELRRGDAFLHNSPYHGCSHPADHTHPGAGASTTTGVHRFTVLAKAHQADCGNSLPTTYMGAAQGRLRGRGADLPGGAGPARLSADIEDIIRMCQMRIRVPEQWWGDYLAMLGAARIGERELLALAAEVGWEGLRRHTRREWFDYSEKRMVEAIRRAARRAARTRSSRHDPFPGTPADGVEIRVAVAVDTEAAHDRDRSARQSRLPALRPQSLARPARARRRWSACSTASITPCRRTPARFRRITRPAARRLHRWHSAPSDQLLGCDHQSRRSRRQSGAMRAWPRSPTGSAWRKAARCIPPSLGVISGVHPSGNVPSSIRSSSA